MRPHSRSVRRRESRRDAGGRVEHASVAASFVKVLADLGVMVALITAVFYYFGWVRTRFQAQQLGFDVSALDLTTADYLLKSLNVLFAPLLALIVVALVLQGIHRRFIVRFVRNGPQSRVFRLSTLLIRAWIPLAASAALLSFTSVQGYAMPLCLLIAVLLACYGRWIRLLRSGHEPWSVTTKVLALALLVLATFWTTERFARTMGEAFGNDIAADPSQLPAVVLYRAEDLRLGDRGVTTSPQSKPETAYRYRYAGLFLLERSGDRYFLITGDADRVIVLPESDDVRIEFVRLEKRTSP